jgi:hypothetical protein
MATHRLPILGFAALPDTSGSVWAEPSSISLSNDQYPALIFRFADTSGKIGLRTRFVVPKNYVGTAKIVLIWGVNATSGNVVWDVDYRAIASGESFDPNSHQESVTGTTAAPGTAFLQAVTTINLTSGNLAVDDVVEMTISRDGADGSDTTAADALLFAALFEYADV